MARNQEKAMSTLSRWRAAQEAEACGSIGNKRPYSANEIKNINECEKWRNQIVKEVTKKISQIQNSSLGEFKVRDMNDQINKMIREKRHWEFRIRELGGPDYFKLGSKMLDKDGREIPGQKGYRYFGAARDLPGVRELFEPEPPKIVKKTRAQMMRQVNADYYGYRDEDDGIIVQLEEMDEQNAIKKSLASWIEMKANKVEDSEDEDIYSKPNAFPEKDDFDDQTTTDHKPDTKESLVQANVPTQDDIEKYLIERQKKALLERYASEELQNQVKITEELTKNHQF